MKIRTKLLLTFIGCGLCPIAIVSCMSYSFAVQGMSDIEETATGGFKSAAESQLVAVRDMKKSQIETYWRDRKKDIDSLASSVASMIDPGSGTSLKRRMESQDDWFTQFRDIYGYYDLFLLSPDGHCFYSVCREADYDTNLITGVYQDSNFGSMIQKIVKTGSFQFADFAPYAPSNNDQAAFIGTPVRIDGELKLIVALQMPHEDINSMMTARAGMGETGHTFLVAVDEATGKTSLRSDMSSVNPLFKIGSPITTSYIESAVHDTDGMGEGVWKNAEGDEVLVAYNRISVFGKDWNLFAKLDAKEAFASVEAIKDLGVASSRSLLGWMTSVSLVVILVVSAIGILLSAMIVKPIKSAVAMLKDIAEGEGDLTRKLDESSNDELGELAHWFNQFVGKLRVMIVSLAGNSKSLGDASKTLSLTASELSGGVRSTNEQTTTAASATKEMTMSMNSMASASEQMTANVRIVAAAATQMADSVREIASAAEHASTVADGAAELTRTSNQRVAALDVNALEIGKVIEVIQEIACQTNLLALNATIEAARAGDAGKGFTVVAEEVKQLARKTAEATEDIRPWIAGIQSSSSDVVAAINDISKVIDEVKEVSRTIASAVEEQTVTTRDIAENVSETSRAAETVAAGITQMACTSSSISKSILSVDESVCKTSTGAEQTHCAGEQLNRLADELDQLVGSFKV